MRVVHWLGRELGLPRALVLVLALAAAQGAPGEADATDLSVDWPNTQSPVGGSCLPGSPYGRIGDPTV